MTNLEDWVHGIESWGFRVVDYDEDTMFFEGIERDDDTMVTYRIAPGVFVDYINIKSRYRSENAAHSGRRGYRIAYCSSGNYYTHINGSKVLITSAEVFVGKAIPKPRLPTVRKRASSLLISWWHPMKSRDARFWRICPEILSKR